MDDKELERLAVEELLGEAKRGKERSETMGPSGWQKRSVTTNKRFLRNTLISTLSEEQKTAYANNSHASKHKMESNSSSKHRRGTKQRTSYSQNDDSRHHQTVSKGSAVSTSTKTPFSSDSHTTRKQNKVLSPERSRKRYGRSESQGRSHPKKKFMNVDIEDTSSSERTVDKVDIKSDNAK